MTAPLTCGVPPGEAKYLSISSDLTTAPKGRSWAWTSLRTSYLGRLFGFVLHASAAMPLKSN